MMADRLHLQPKHRQVLEALLREHLPDVEVWAYGSRVSGQSHEGSDLDLVLRGPGLKEIPIGRLGDFEEAVRESTIPFLVEARDWSRLPERFHREIERDHKVLIERKELPASEQWREFSLGELTDNFDSIRVPVKREDRRSGPYPYYGASGVVDYVDDYLFDGEFLLIAEDGENLRTRNTPIAFLADGKLWVNNHAHIVQGSHKANTRFLMYALSDLDISGYLTGSTMPKLTQDNLNRISLRAPPLHKQEAIAHILGTLDDKIELNRRMNETLEAMARALFKSWFVDFDPVRAKMEGRDPGLTQPLADLFPDRLVDSEIGEIPEGWEISHVDQLAIHHTKSTTPSSSPDTEFEHFSIPAYDSGHVPAIEKGVAIKSNKTVMPSGSILLSKLNPEIPRIWMPDTSSCGPQICSTEFLVFTPRSPANRSILFSLFTDGVFRSLLQSMVTGTSKSHQRVPPKALKQCQVISGTPTLFGKFGQVTVSTLNQVVEKRGESKNLATLRDVLLPKLISGEIRLREAEKVVEAVA